MTWFSFTLLHTDGCSFINDSFFLTQTEVWVHGRSRLRGDQVLLLKNNKCTVISAIGESLKIIYPSTLISVLSSLLSSVEHGHNHSGLVRAIWTWAGLGPAGIPGWLIRSWMLRDWVLIWNPSTPGYTVRPFEQTPASWESARNGGVIIWDNSEKKRRRLCIWKESRPYKETESGNRAEKGL